MNRTNGGRETAAPPLVPHQRTAATPSGAAPDPVDRLAAQLGDCAAAAVHPDEIAAVLESDGLSDDQIRERYGVRDSFALAEELYARVPRHHPEPDAPPHDPWRIGLPACLLRGLLFALPGLAYVLGAPLLTGPPGALGLPPGTVPLLAGALFGWTWNQGLAHRAYAWLGLGERAAARRCLLVGAPVGALLGALVPPLFAGPADGAAVLFAAGQSCYLGASTTLLVLGRERALLAALTPLTAGALLALARPVPDPLALALLVGSLTAVMLLGLLSVAPAVRAPASGADAPAAAASLPYALFGLGSGALVLYAALGDLLAGREHGALAAPSAVALTLSMGPAEWLLYRFRSGSLAGLRTTGTPHAFRRATLRTGAACLTAYLLVLLALGLSATALWPDTPALTAVRLADLLLLGVVLWTGLLLQSFGAVRGPAAVCCAAAVAQTVALLTRQADPHGVALTVYATAAAVQALLVRTLLGRATAHR
ncbi:hypothetical protein [Streptomyces sp. DSM 15324]|uniref:hypothetical protein n=1 Tax=Streptomyces sp. DSM 15324 TaxID=1739111 RepID=UPI000AA6DE6C|nr:hypothetical protein [Streptomyces sp. DSM 15324]